MDFDRLEYFKKVVVLVFGIVFSVLMIEVFMFLMPELTPNVVRLAAVIDFNDEIRQSFKPNIQTTQTLQDGNSWLLSTTDLGLGDIGFRDDGLEEKAKIVVVGDSHVYGHGVNIEEVWTEILEEKTGVDVVNMGLPTAFPEIQLKILEGYGLKVQPKTVIFSVFQNDWVDAISFEDEKIGFTRVKRELDSYSSVYRLVRFAIRYSDYIKYEKYDIYESKNISLVLYPLHMGSSVYIKDLKIKFGRDSMEKSILAASSLSEKEGFEIVFVVFPSKEQVYWDSVSQYAPSNNQN